ncbi:mRNA interferase HigB [Algoriphagus locisalis]|uniref:mRNA interferase HigB n=1 Tax=Algoriphagus locisalis TaxID=305507 RepID=A0A1I6YK18_9BACT|nr:type II toxin-antitoxin system HigB family toxin [Algoriphagus locisalis]SFT50839.1 mRNA interferase HigB [Algoriphagus locisalis]
MKNIISIKNLVQFYQKHPDSKSSIETWIAVTKHADWKKSLDILGDFPDADPVKNNRVVFNIARNKYRLIVQICYLRQWVFIKFIGTHSEYDKVDVSTVDLF